MIRQKMSDSERKIRRKVANNKWRDKRKATDPNFMAHQCQIVKDSYKRRMKDPSFVEKHRVKSLHYYYNNVVPFPEKRQMRRAQVAGYQKKRRERFNETKIKLQELIGGKCVQCEITDDRLLDFDHIDPSTKTMMISQSLNLPFEVLVEEVKKCQLLCANCHRLKTLEDKEKDAYKHREYRNKFRTPFRPLKLVSLP